MSLPDFLVVGAEKAGTRTLNRMLSDHPDVFMCPLREPKFFSGTTWGKGVAWYESLFADAGSAKRVGETSPAYTWHPAYHDAPGRINAVLGNIQYVYIVRDPVKRMISHYNHARFCHWIPVDVPMDEALKKVPMIRECSRYMKQIKQYLVYSDRTQWHVFSIEELHNQPDKEQAALFDFLGVDSTVQIAIPRENVLAEKLQMPKWYRPVYRTLRHVRDFVPPSIRCWMWQSRSKVGRQLPEAKITDDFLEKMRYNFAEDVNELSEFTGRDYLKLWGYQ